MINNMLVQHASGSGIPEGICASGSNPVSNTGYRGGTLARAGRRLAVVLVCLALASTVLGSETVKTAYGSTGKPTRPKQEFSVVLSLKGNQTISGFHFRVVYDASQVTLTNVSDNTSQSAASVVYDLGQESPTKGLPGRANAYRNVLMTTSQNLVGARSLGELHFVTKPGFSGNAAIAVTDAKPVDGLFNGSYENIDHDFALLEQ